MDLHRHLRSLALLIFILATYFSTTLARHHPVRHRHNRHKRNHHHHSNATYLTGSFVISGTPGEPELGNWGPWSEPSECSRSCGGGVASQTRQCRDVRSDGSFECQGGNKRYFSCNIQDCPDGATDYRGEQCAEFNKVPFEGRNYEWVPYHKAPNKCELNCMPRGERFYYRHKRKVVDGTRCDEEKLDICVEGQCLPVGCDMMLGSTSREDKCRECRGDGSSCRTIKDVLEMDDMQVGYNDILLIPAGATNIKVEEIRASNNYLAIRNVSNHYYLNGNWRIDFPRSLKFAGTIFHYERKPHAFLAPETITALGPTTEAIYIVFLYQEKNPGVAYEYSIHRGISQPDEPDSYSWIFDEFSECSVSCGGGQQSRSVTCVRRKNLEVVANNLCNPVLEPKQNQSCNTDPCPPQWSLGEWGACSETCGDGTQVRQVYCERVVSSGLPSVVEDEQCSDVLGPKPTTMQKCKEDMPCPSWHIGPWKPCDRLCGDGRQRRRVRCFRRVDGKIEVLGDSSCSGDKPEEDKPCLLRPCEGVDWVLSEWSGCEDKCGLTHETRRVHCANQAGKVYPDSSCHRYRLPELTRKCENYESCDSEWFASQWSECSADCGTGIKTRKVFCGSFDGETVKKADNSKCDPRKKYESIENCTGKAECPGQWYSGPWSPCTKKCGGGDMSRKVLCYIENQSVEPNKCDSALFPFLSTSCNNHPCTDDQIMTVEPSHEVSEDEECEDEEEDGKKTTFITLQPNLRLDEIGFTADSSDEVGSGEVETTLSGRVTETGRSFHVDLSSSSYTSSESMSSSSSFEFHDLTTKSTLLDVSSESSIGTVSFDDIMLSDSTGFFTDAESILTIDPSSTDDPFSTDDSYTTDDYSVTESTTLIDDISSILIDSTSSTVSESKTDEETSSSSPVVSTTESALSSTTESSLSSTTESHLSSITDTDTPSTDETDLDSTTTEYSTSSVVSSTTETIDSTTITSESDSATPTSSADSVAVDSSSMSSISGGTSESDVTTESPATSETDITPTSSTEEVTTPTTDSSSMTSVSDEILSSTAEEALSSTESSHSTTESISEGTSGIDSVPTSTTDVEESSTSTLLSMAVSVTTYEAPSEVDEVIPEDKIAEETFITEAAETTYTTEPSSTSMTEETTSESSITQTSDATSTEKLESTSETTTESETEEASTGTTEGTDPTIDLVTESTSEQTSEGTTDQTTQETTESSTEETIELSTESPTEETTEGTTEITTAGSTDSSLTTPSESSAETTGPSESSAEPTSHSESTSFGTTDESSSSSSPDITTEEYFSTTLGEITTSALDLFATTPSPAQAAVTKEQKVRKCRRKKPKKPKPTCSDSKFGCCADGVTEAQGPFSKGCPQPETCSETKLGCCSDGVSPALGPNDEGCPPSLCSETLFGCCPDKVSIAEGNDFEGCKDEMVPFDCSETQFGCCPDNITKASGPNLEGCFECEGSGDCESCNDTKYGCCPDELRAASGENYTGCDEFEGSGFMMVSSTTEEPEDCPVSTFGCCPDGFTSAEGPNFAGCGVINKDNCTLSYFGCCPDGTSPALGPEFTGCHMPCEDDTYGCCEDRITPAHGRNREGCCLGTQFGCCPDNILPAQGSKLEGCGCQYTAYGCCPDNSTAARGPSAEGCGCQFTPNGCCPNRYTPAAGPNFQGCPCYTYQFGCCPDGVTVATGPRSQGCGCENTEFGCCSDERTPASGPERTGCSCESSKYGCCPDGISEADGDKFEGCTNVPIIPAEACTKKRERGPCRDFTVKWFFDMEYGGCSRFWYGGCGGNNNRFKTQDECKDTCVEPQGRDACYLPKIAGPCEGYYPTWYYDTERKQCGQFIYGGCLGNNNKFQTEEECDELCVLPDTIDSCEQSRQEGPCKGNFTRWYYDKEEHMCQRFTYGGCKGNANNFATESACHQQCLQPGKSRVMDICALPKDMGPCPGAILRWHFDATEQSCKQFMYGGCQGNSNRFKTEEECKNRCHVSDIAREQDVCTLQALIGECHNYTERWYYNSYEVRCTLFYYGGCGGNNNNFLTMQDCQQHCESGYGTPQPIEEFKRESCFLPSEQGPCSGSTAQWFYDSQDGVCKQFLYGGCHGNANRFSSQQECESKCNNVQELCDLPRVVGPCNGNYRQWYYDRTIDECQEFEYGGCQGNANRFNDRRQCEERCRKALSTAGPDVSTLLLTTQDPSSNEIQPTDICSTPVDAGPCRDTHNAWFYNERTGGCEAFVYGGCGGNANRYESSEQCERQCGAFKGQDVCNIPYDIGHCRALIPKWYYDASSRVCRQFNYGGCEGNGNRFSSIEECESICFRREEILPTGNDTTLSHRAICRLRVDSGPCPGGHYKRWYFDEDRLTCIPFIYTGCAGNLNRFKNFQTCLNFCSVLLREANDTESRPPPEIPEDYCKQAREQCYQLHCPYGVEKSVNEYNCEVCGCHDPCYGRTCPEGSNCAVDLYRNPSTDKTEFRAICRTVNKPGDCPRQVNTTGKCSEECQSDADCTGDFKCCFTGCGSSCVHPAVPEEIQLTTAGPFQFSPVHSGREEPPRFDSTETEVVAEQGSYATLQCVARGHPTPTISWRKGSVQIDGAGGRHKLLLDGSLQVIGLYRQDSGLYTCTAENGVGSPVHKDFSLHVTEPTRRPAVIIGEDSTFVVVTLGASTTLQCHAVGWPTPLVTWWRGERMLPLSSEVYEQRRDFSLVIRSMTLRNLGPYTCQAYNGLGRAASWTVTVQAIGPVYTVNPQDSNYTKYLIPPPKKPEQPSSPFRPPIQPVHPKKPRPAVILPPEPEVVAATEVPPIVPESTATRRPPAVYEVPVEARINLEKTVYPVGSDISIPCDVAGHPIPSVQWYKEDEPVETSDRIQITESHRILIVRADKTDAGTYRCEATNAYGSSSNSITILVEGVFIHPNCTDNPFFANCRLIVAARYCTHKYYARFCCMSCTQAGQLPSHGPHLDVTGAHSKHVSRRK